jgi:hypothetical protein
VAWGSLSDRVRAGLAVTASLHLDARWQLGLRLLGSLPETDDVVIDTVPRGQVTAQHFAALLRAGPCFGERIAVCPEALAGARFGWARASGPFLFQTATAWLVRPALGPALRLDLKPFPWLVASLGVAATFTLWNQDFPIEGAPQQVAHLTLAELFGTLTVAWVRE